LIKKIVAKKGEKMSFKNLLQSFAKIMIGINHSVICKKAMLILSFCLFCLLASCSSPPQDIKDAAMNKIWAQNGTGCFKNDEVGRLCKDFQVSCSKNYTLTKADQANKITESWCLVINYLFKYPGNDWIENIYQAKVIRKNGTVIVIDGGLTYDEPTCCGKTSRKLPKPEIGE
jgi:hypothetical protein